MPLKMSLSPSIATKWRLALRKAWTEAPVENQGRCKQKNKNKKSQGHNKEVIKKLRTYGCSAIKNYVVNLRGGLNEQLEKEGVLLPTTSPRSAASHELTVLCTRLKRTSSTATSIPTESSSAIGQMEKVEEGSLG
jgi:hypothetical protein